MMRRLMGRASASFEDVGELWEPILVIDGGIAAGRGFQPRRPSEAQDGMGQLVEPVAYFFAGHVAEGSHGEADQDAKRSQEIAGHAVLPCGLGQALAGTGGRY